MKKILFALMALVLMSGLFLTMAVPTMAATAEGSVTPNTVANDGASVLHFTWNIYDWSGTAAYYTFAVYNFGSATPIYIQYSDGAGVDNFPGISGTLTNSVNGIVGAPTVHLLNPENPGTHNWTVPSTFPAGNYWAFAYLYLVGQSSPAAGAFISFNIVHPAISIVKTTNGNHETAAPGHTIAAGAAVTWTYTVTNAGDVPLSAVSVTDSVAGVNPAYVSGDTNANTLLDLTETWIFSASGTAVAGQYHNTGTATGTPPAGPNVTAADDSWYFSKANSKVVTDLNPKSITLGTGATVIDTATVTSDPAGGTTPTGNVTFQVKGPGDANFANFGANPVTLNASGIAASSAYTPTVAGTYYFRAIYNGDGKYNVSQSADTAEALAVTAPTPAKCRITGGGTIDGTKVRHGFELHCDKTQLPNSLEVNWGNGNKFHLLQLTSATCFYDPAVGPPNPPTAACNTYYGEGIGRYNGVDGAHAVWTFTDAGEPGINDWASIKITDPSGNVVLNVQGYLHNGNQQFHNCTGIDLR